MGKYRFAYWFILIITLIMESSLQILYSYVTKKTLNAIEFQNMQLFRTAVIPTAFTGCNTLHFALQSRVPDVPSGLP